MRQCRTEASQAVGLYSAFTGDQIPWRCCRGDNGAHCHLPQLLFRQNRPCDFSTLYFVDKVLKVLKEQPLRFIHRSMSMIIMVECVEKVSARIRKSQKAKKEAGEINIAQSSPSKNLSKLVVSWEGLDILQIVSSFLIELETFNTATPIMKLNPETSMMLCLKAFLIGTITLYLFIGITSFLIQS